MRIIYFCLLILGYSSCLQKANPISIFNTANFILIDTNAEATEFLNFADNINDYPIYFIGYKADSIKIGKRYWDERTKWEDNFSEPLCTTYSAKTLNIFVDTSVKANSPLNIYRKIKGQKEIQLRITAHFF